jgi:LmbE family N-acetylglucosaminyl deacetylase
MNIRKLVDSLLDLNHLRKFAGFAVLKNVWGSGFKLQVVARPPRGRVLVLSPHPDDDVLGGGGALALHARQGDRVKIIYLFDGSGGEQDPARRRAIARNREAEARLAAQILGANYLEFWRVPDGASILNRSCATKLTRVWRAFAPDIIYAPSFLDPHPDHCATARLLAFFLKKYNFQGLIYSYEVWAPQFINRLVSIDATKELKVQAIKAHRSQLEARGYLDAMIGLAKYRAGMFGAGGYAEGFLSCRRQLYLSLFDLIKKK